MKRVMALCVAGLMASMGAATAEESALLQTAQANAGGFVVLFPFDQATLDSEALGVIAAAAQEFQRSGSARIALRGHTDTSGNSAYNQALSERREQAVADELLRQGVPASALTGEAVGETDLAVATADGVPEQANRRVEIVIDKPPVPVAAAAPAPTPAPAPIEAAPPPPSPKRDRIFSLGGFYGFNLEDEAGHTSHLGGLNFAVDVPVMPWLSLGAEQAGFYHFDTPNDGFGGRTVASVDFTMGDDDEFRPYIGGNIGYLYGSGFNDDFIAGPEVGILSGPFIAKLAYDIPFNRDMDEGIINTTIGFRF